MVCHSEKTYDARILSGYYSSNICKYEKNKIRIFLLWNILQDKSSTKTINNCYCQLAEDTANLTPPDKKPCPVQEREGDISTVKSDPGEGMPWPSNSWATHSQQQTQQPTPSATSDQSDSRPTLTGLSPLQKPLRALWVQRLARRH